MRIAQGFMLVLVAASLSLSLPAPAAAATSDPIVKRLLDAKGTPFEVDEDGDYKILVSYKSEGRTQVVFVRSVVETYGKQRVREVWSYGYQGDKDQFSSLVANRLLDASNKVKLGSWVKQGKSAVFVVKVSAESSADELDDAIDAAAAAADEMEKELTEGKDEF
jgi:hypothetical protein